MCTCGRELACGWKLLPPSFPPLEKRRRGEQEIPFGLWTKNNSDKNDMFLMLRVSRTKTKRLV